MIDIRTGEEPCDATIATFASGSMYEHGTCVGVAAGSREDLTLLLFDRSPFYPVNQKWPDQPSDSGHVRALGHQVEVKAVSRGWLDADGGLNFVGKGAAVTCHEVPNEWTDEVLGADFVLQVRARRRTQLSRHHTLCHLSGLALNEICSGWFTKDTPFDSRGFPDFDSIAITSSTISEERVVDVYRVGKSWRKRHGFMRDEFLRSMSIEKQLNEIVGSWIEKGSPASISAEGPYLEDRRTWVSIVDGVRLSMPCGGTHVESLTVLGEPSVSVTADPELQTMTVVSTLSQ